MEHKIPIVYSYIYFWIEKKSKTNILDRKFIMEIVSRSLVRKRGGFPRILVKYIIDDLVRLKLLERIDYQTYSLIKNGCKEEIRKKMLLL